MDEHETNQSRVFGYLKRLRTNIKDFLFKKHRSSHQHHMITKYSPSEKLFPEVPQYMTLNEQDMKMICHDLYQNLEDEIKNYQAHIQAFYALKRSDPTQQSHFDEYLTFTEIKLKHLKEGLETLIKLVEATLDPKLLYLTDFFKHRLEEKCAYSDYKKLSKIYSLTLQKEPLLLEIHKSLLDYFNFRDHFAVHLCCDTTLLLQKINQEKKLLKSPKDQTEHLQNLHHAIELFHQIRNHLNRSTKLLTKIMHNSYLVHIKRLMGQIKFCIRNYPYIDVNMIENFETSLRKSMERLNRIRMKNQYIEPYCIKDLILLDPSQNDLTSPQRKKLSCSELNHIYALYKTQLESLKLITIAVRQRSSF